MSVGFHTRGSHNIVLFNSFNKFFTDTLLTLCLYSANDVTSKWHYTSIISFLLHDFVTLLHGVLCDNLIF